jgi:uncharacterized repeat protein (TIGR02543 family)
MKKYGVVGLLALGALLVGMAGCRLENDPEEMYTVTYDANGAEGEAPSPQIAAAGTTIVLADGTRLRKIDHVFDLWNTRLDGSGNQYAPGDSFTVSNSVALYAQWMPASAFTIIYDANAPDSELTGALSQQQIVTAGAEITVAGGFSRNRYRFDCWNTQADGTGTSYDPGDSLPVNGSVTLYAQWTPLYTVTYNANGGTTGNPPPPRTEPVGTKIMVSGNTGNLQKEDGAGLYGFYGWNTRETGMGTTYTAGTVLTVDKDLTLYAQWSPPTVYYHPNGATGGTVPAPRTLEPGETTIPVAGKGTLTKEGLEFAGWSAEPNGAGQVYAHPDDAALYELEGTLSTLTVTGVITLYAQWSYTLGGPGQAGGVIFYDKGSYSDGWRYMEAAPADVGSYSWAGDYNGMAKVCNTGTEIGTGLENTALLTAENHGHGHPAAQACADYQYGGYDDWFLPSKDELNQMYVELKNKGIGSFGDAGYWSSSQYPDYVPLAWYQNFSDGTQGQDFKAFYPRNIRPARRF